ncbi:MAG: GHKL domain-containing protein [Acutalibacteraceae bacterium]|nr:GHKL domain-containing protein [Acutalibacteraceae bacterium]
MLFSPEWEKFLWEGIFFLTYVLICSGLMERRFSKTASLLAAGGTLVGIVLLQAALLLAGQDNTLVLTMLPLTAYLPAVICLHILSRSGFFQTMAIWTIATIAYFVLKILWKILMQYFGQLTSFSTWVCNLLMAGLLVFLVFRFLRKPFRTYVLENQTNWLLLSFPVLMVFLLFSYVGNSTTDGTLLVLLLLTAFSIFLVLIRVLTSSAAMARMKESEKAVSIQLQMQRREYEDVCKKMEMGRTYRHDMRHHLLVLEGLAKQSDTESMAQYIGNLNGQLSEIEKESYCENSTVNAVLASCIGQAKEAHCTVTAKIYLPGDIPFDEMDICVVLANALENAVNACKKVYEEDKRYIHVAAELVDGRKLTISVENPCNVPLSFQADGFPIVPEREGHGIGLKSIDAVTKKYNGMFHCECKEGEFRFKAVLFNRQNSDAPADKRNRNFSKKVASSVLLSMLAFFLFVNCMPVMAQVLTQVPGLGMLVRLADLRSYGFHWGDTSFEAVLPVLEAEDPLTNSKEEQPEESTPTGPQTTPSQPELTESAASASGSVSSANETASEPALLSGTISMESSATPSRPSVGESQTSQSPAESQPDTPAEPTRPALPTTPTEPTSPPLDISDGVEDLNQQMEEYISQMREKFLWYVARKYEGYVGLDTTYQVLRNDDMLLSVRFETTINVGGSGQYSRSFTLDKQTGKVLELGALFQPNSDYVGVISAEILRQMKQQVEAGEADYFIPGGIWSEEECFKEIDADQNFYINDQNQLVIVFDEYEVAPGSMGMPEFVLPTDILKEILQQLSILG